MPPNTDIIRVFARRTKWTPTDDLAFYDEPPMFELPDLPVYVSVTFTWDRSRGERLARAWRRCCEPVFLSGPAFEHFPSYDFIPGRFIKPGVTFTSRGCPKNCPWCLVPRREGELREIPIQPGHIVQDNNLLACGRPRIEAVFDMLRRQKKGIKFSGGLDIDYLRTWHVALLKTIKVAELWVACDTEAAMEKLDKAADLLSDFPIEKKRCYVLCGFQADYPAAAEKRLEAVYKKGFLPFAQLYRGPPLCASDARHRREDWNELIRKWSRPAIYRSCHR